MADGALAPTPYDNEQMVLGRSGVRIIIDNMKTATKRCVGKNKIGELCIERRCSTRGGHGLDNM